MKAMSLLTVLTGRLTAVPELSLTAALVGVVPLKTMPFTSVSPWSTIWSPGCGAVKSASTVAWKLTVAVAACGVTSPVPARLGPKPRRAEAAVTSTVMVVMPLTLGPTVYSEASSAAVVARPFSVSVMVGVKPASKVWPSPSVSVSTRWPRSK